MSRNLTKYNDSSFFVWRGLSNSSKDDGEQKDEEKNDEALFCIVACSS